MLERFGIAAVEGSREALRDNGVIKWKEPESQLRGEILRRAA